MRFDVVCFRSKDPEKSEVDILEESDYTGIISFPDFKIPSNPKYFKLFINKVLSKKCYQELLVARHTTSQMEPPSVNKGFQCERNEDAQSFKLWEARLSFWQNKNKNSPNTYHQSSLCIEIKIWKRQNSPHAFFFF